MTAQHFIEEARNRFLWSIWKLPEAQSVLETLAGDPFDAFRELEPAAQVHITRTQRRLPSHASLGETLTNWLRQWGLDAEWCAEVALNTLRCWTRSEQLFERREWAWRTSGWMQEETTVKVWTPGSDETLSEARRRLELDIARLERRGRAARTRGIPVEPFGFSDATVEAAVRFQVLREPLERIARNDPSALRRSVYDLLDRIGLPRRRTRGRPRKASRLVPENRTSKS